jgi:hypothetical protein
VSRLASECLSDPFFVALYYQFEVVEEVRRATATTTPTGQSSRRPKYTIAGVLKKNALILEAYGSSHKQNV